MTEAAKKPFYYFLFLVALSGLLGRFGGYFLPIYFKEIGISGFGTGLYFSLSSLSVIFFTLPMGIHTDRKSIAIILAFSFFLMSISTIGFIISKSLLVFCLFSFIGSFGGRFHSTSVNSLFFKLSGVDNRREAGLFQLFTFVFTGISMLLGGYIINYLSFRHMFIITLAGYWLLAILSLFLPKNETVVISLEEYKKAVLTPKVLFLTFIFFLSSIHWGAEVVSYAPFLKENLHLGFRGIGWYTSLGFIVVGISAYIGSIIINRGWIKDIQTLLSIGFFLSGLFHILMCVPNLSFSFAFRLIHEVGDGFVMLAFYSGIARIFHIDAIGGSAAFISLCMGLGSFLSSMLFGYLGSAIGNQWPLMISGFVSAILPLLLKFSRHKVFEKIETVKTN